MELVSVRQTKVKPNRRIALPDGLEDVDQVEWRLGQGDTVRVFETVGPEADRGEFVDVTTAADGEYVRPPRELADRFEEGDVVFWLWWRGASGAYWNLVDEDTVIDLMESAEIDDL